MWKNEKKGEKYFLCPKKWSVRVWPLKWKCGYPVLSTLFGLFLWQKDGPRQCLHSTSKVFFKWRSSHPIIRHLVLSPGQQISQNIFYVQKKFNFWYVVLHHERYLVTKGKIPKMFWYWYITLLVWNFMRLWPSKNIFEKTFDIVFYITNAIRIWKEIV